MTFAEKLKSLRTKNGYSQEELAEALNVSRQAITKWESGKGMPDIQNLIAISDLFDVTLDSLMREEEELETSDESSCTKGSMEFIWNYREQKTCIPPTCRLLRITR
ncbi:helix-turn-helix transcriptional regulator, partial [Eubacteriales bacterium DFI.9.88]|nr:helix-turn-helix transcriptional regulator [Eubacteriales bacterium DFI.9.88]